MQQSNKINLKERVLELCNELSGSRNPKTLALVRRYRFWVTAFTIDDDNYATEMIEDLERQKNALSAQVTEFLYGKAV